MTQIIKKNRERTSHCHTAKISHNFQNQVTPKTSYYVIMKLEKTFILD